MVVTRRVRGLSAAAGSLALVGGLGVGAAVAPAASSAPRSASGTPGPAAVAVPAVRLPMAVRLPRPVRHAPVEQWSAAPAAGALTVRHARVRSRLTLTVARGATLAVTGVLSRASSGARLVGRRVELYLRTPDSGAWRHAATLRTSSRGRIAYLVRQRPLLQLTLRFGGDRSFGPAASVTVVPAPSATRLDRRLVAALGKARSAARRAGLSLVVNSGWRSWAKQQRMYAAAVRRYGSDRAARRWVLPAQESTHVRGLAVDLGTPAAAAWLALRSGRYGLCRSYAGEAWHFEYRPDWIRAFGGRCPAPVRTPGDPDPLSPAPRIAVV
jgi:D-alanyl-D-alanine carboxypeptidase